MHDDRHGRSRRTVNDPRRRPAEGFGVRDPARFHRLVATAAGTLPVEVRAALADLEATVDPALAADVDPRRTVTIAARDGGPHRLLLHRRALEDQATSAAHLTELVAASLVAGVAEHLGWDDDRLEELGWDGPNDR